MQSVRHKGWRYPALFALTVATCGSINATALLLVVAAEMIGAQQGIGAFVLTAGSLMQTDQLLAGVVMLSVLGLLIAWGLGMLERRMLKWR